MITRRFILTGMIAAPAVIAADKLIKVYSLPERYATVYGVGWDLEVIEHPIWEPMSVAHFGGTPAIDQFREVTAFVHAFPVEPLGWSPHNSGYLKKYGSSYGIPAETISTAAYGEYAVAERLKAINQYASHEPDIITGYRLTRPMAAKDMGPSAQVGIWDPNRPAKEDEKPNWAKYDYWNHSRKLGRGEA